MKTLWKVAGMTILTFKYLDFRVRNIFKDDEGYFTLEKGAVYQEEIAILITCTFLTTKLKLDMDTGLQCQWRCGWDETNSQGLPSPVVEKGWHSCSLKGRAPRPFPWQAFIGLICIGIQGIYGKLINHCQAVIIK